MAERYEILKGLPGTGPRYVTVSGGLSYASDYSEGFVVRFFKSDGEDWIANFKTGFSQFDAVFELDNQNLLVIAGGATYIMNPDHEVPVAARITAYKQGFQTSDGIIILYDNTEITVFKKDGTFWISDRISLDGLDNITVKNNIITGQYSDYSRDWNWFDFSLNLDTKELTGIIYEAKPTPKPWWKFW